MFDLQPPRHISTLRNLSVVASATGFSRARGSNKVALARQSLVCTRSRNILGRKSSEVAIFSGGDPREHAIFGTPTASEYGAFDEIELEPIFEAAVLLTPR
jgi:hypothetical protein